MASPASIARHPLHPMLIVFPIGLWVFSLVADLFFLGTGEGSWSRTAYYTMIGGTIGGLAAALPGFIDYLSIKDERVNAIATRHMILNLIIVILYVINILQRRGDADILGLPLALSIAGNILLVISGWLGGHLVYVHGMAVEPEARK